MTISVTQHDIDQGDCALCPIERAFLREHLETLVGPNDVSFFAGKRYILTLPLPQIARDFVHAFDTTERGQTGFPGPFEFDLPIPKEVFEEAA